MEKLKITYLNYVRCRVEGLTQSDRNIVYNHFSVFVPTAKFTPKYKIGVWDGYEHYFSVSGLFYINLLEEMYSVIDISKYEIEIINNNVFKEPKFNIIDNHYLSNYKWWKGHRLEGLPVEIYDHQVDIINSCLKNPRGIIVAATSAGKTLCSLVIAKEVSKYGKFLLIEPSKDLTLQTAQTFRNLGVDCGICGCGYRELDKNIIICTWQTIDSLERRRKSLSLDEDKSLLSKEELLKLKDGLVGILFDECHGVKSYNCRKITEDTFQNVPLRWGLTGTLPKSKADLYSLIIGLGKVIHVLDSKELQDKGILAQCDITCIRLKSNLSFATYSDELEYLSTNENRLKFIGTLIHNIVQKNGNTLVLVNRIVCGEKLEEIIRSLGSKCIFLDGSVKSTLRFDEYESIKTENNKCIICTSAIASTGIDIPRLFNLVLLDYGKSFIKSIQSIGRGLRLGKDKTHCDIFDISSTTGFSRKHFNDRIHYYNEKKFPFKVFDIKNY